MRTIPLTSTLEQAWHTLVPPRDDPNGPLPPLLLALTVVTGLVDAFSYLVLGHVFVANMTGNVVFLAFALAGAHGFSIPASLLALLAFFLGAGAGGVLGSRRGSHRGRLLALTALLEALLLLAATVLAAAAANPGRGAARYILIVLLGAAMGAQNATARRLAVPDLTTTVLTLTITGVAADSRFANGPGMQLGRRGLAVLTMFVGAIIGSFLSLDVSKPLNIAVALIVVAGVSGFAAVASRSRGAWSVRRS
jgi:uncharacterized membrane protein YoaK (UPF0700 family)